MSELLEPETYLENPSSVDEAIFWLTGTNAEDYDERPTDIETFVKDKHYLNCEEVVRPAVMKDLKDMFSDENVFAHCPYEEAVFDEAIGTGKTFKTSIILAYGLHHLLCLKNPQSYFGLDRVSMIAMMNMSVNALQAKKVVFGELRSRILSSPWFEKHLPDPSIRSELRFEKNITVIPGHSGETYPLGYNIIMAVMDEASFYTQTEDHDVAEEMFYALRRRITTRFSGNGLIIIISSPRYTDDFIERKSGQALKEPHRIFGRRKTIWEVLPDDIAAIYAGDYFVHDGTRIPNRYFDEFERNPDKAWRDLGARPSLVLEPYIKQYNLVTACVDAELRNPELGPFLLAEWFKGDPRFTYYIHIDIGITRDACGIAMSHREAEMVTVDMIMRIQGSVKQEVGITEIRNLVMALRKRGFALGKVTYDQFQSAESIQELNKQHITSERLSVDKDLGPYETLKELCYTGKVRYYYHQVFLEEMHRLELREGKKVDHPARGSKDCSDAVAGSVFNTLHGVSTRQATMKIL